MTRFRGPSFPGMYVGPNTTADERERIYAEHDALQTENERAAEERRKLAAPVLASVADYPPETLELVGRALELGGGPLAGVGRALLALADRGGPGWAVTKLAGSLLELADDDEIYDRLEYAEEPPWPALRAALEEIRADAAQPLAATRR